MSEKIEDLINFISTLLNARLSDKHFINVANNETWLELSNIKLALLELQSIKEANPSEALECLEKIIDNLDDYADFEIKQEANEYIDTIKQSILKAQKEDKIISGIEDYLNQRIKVEPIEDVKKAFIEIRNQLQVIKEVLK